MTDAELIVFIRFWIGNLPVSEISDGDLTTIISGVRLQYPDASDCLLKYYSVKRTLEWLLRKDNQATSGSDASGAVSKRLEEIGNRKIEIQYATNGVASTSGGYQDILDMLEEDPSSLGCDPFPSSSPSTSTVIVGGVSQAQYDKVADNPDSRTGFAMGSLCRPRNRNWR
jgi:hypothetical protein